jgi:hypothetical protein
MGTVEVGDVFTLDSNRAVVFTVIHIELEFDRTWTMSASGVVRSTQKIGWTDRCQWYDAGYYLVC